MSNNEQKKYMREIDAMSRLAIYIANQANRKSISQCGALYQNENNDGGFTSSDHAISVLKDAHSVIFRVQVQPAVTSQIWIDAFHEALASNTRIEPVLGGPPSEIQPFYQPTPESNALVPAFHAANQNAWTFQPMTEIQCDNAIVPHDLPNLLTRMTGQTDYIYLSNSLGLDKKDYDNVKQGILVRCRADNDVNLPLRDDWIGLPTYEQDGTFLRMYVLSNECVFELKAFNDTVRRCVIPFCFIPKHSAIWFRAGEPQPGAPIIIDTDVNAVYYGTSLANAGLIDAGDIKKIEWELLRDHKVLYVWRPGGNDRNSRIRFEKALRFLAEAKRHGINASLITPENERLDIKATIVQARRFKLDIPAVLKETGYVHFLMPQKEFVPDGIPSFWSKGSATLFFGPGYSLIMEKLMRAFSGTFQNEQGSTLIPDADQEDGTVHYVFPQKQVGILYPPKAGNRVNKLINRIGLDTPGINSEIDLDDLETAIFQYEIQAMFIAYAEKIPSQKLADILDLCGRTKVVVGIFSGTEGTKENPIPEDVLSSETKELVAQSYKVTVDNDDVIGRDATSGTVKRYHFKGSVVFVSNTNNTNTKEI